MSDADEPSPPGTPMREDHAAVSRQPGGHDDEVSGGRAANESAEEAGGGTIPVDREQPAPEVDRDEDEALQEENAETSLDQPSQ